jgi:hypothetical protein
MKLSGSIHGTKELKKRSYLVLKKMERLENGKRVAHIYTRFVQDDPNDLYVIRCLGHLKELIELSCASIEDPGVAKRLTKLLIRIDRLSSEIKERAGFNNKLLRHVSVGKDILNAHTALFNFLLERNYLITLHLPEWIDTTNTAVAVWGDDIAPRVKIKRLGV